MEQGNELSLAERKLKITYQTIRYIKFYDNFLLPACDGKHAYSTKQQAYKVLGRSKDKSTIVYKCPACKLFHIGTKTLYEQSYIKDFKRKKQNL